MGSSIISSKRMSWRWW